MSELLKEINKIDFKIDSIELVKRADEIVSIFI
jgi:hypothetical protein